ncbi:unnamed protein product [Rotaria socialis]
MYDKEANMSGFIALPDLVLLEIMSYLTPIENLYSFFDSDNKLRCNNLLRECRYYCIHDCDEITKIYRTHSFCIADRLSQGDDLAYVLEQTTQLNHLTLNNVNDTNIKRVFEKYLHRLQSFICDSSLPTQMTFPVDPYILSTFSVVLYQLSDLLVFIVNMPQLQHLKLDMFENYTVDEAERL